MNDNNKDCESERLTRIYQEWDRTETMWDYSYLMPGNEYMLLGRERATHALLRKMFPSGFKDVKVLEIGCGRGNWFFTLLRCGFELENLFGIEMIAESVARLKSVCPAANVEIGNAESMKFIDNTFDMVIISTVFSSVFSEEMRNNIARESVRVLKPGGAVLWYDFRVNNPRNPDVRGVKRKQIVGYFPDCSASLKSVTLAPPIARRVAPFSFFLCELLELFPMLRTHIIGLIHKRT